MKTIKFILLSYLIPIFLSIFMIYGHSINLPIDIFIATFMLMPSFAVTILNKAYINNYFFKVYILATIIFSILSISSVFIRMSLIHVITNYLFYIFSIILWILLYFMPKESKIKHGLLFKNNFLKGLKYVYLYIFILILVINISSLIITHKFTNAFGIKEFFSSLFIPIDFFLTFIIFFGEEYGWRAFLQPRLQEKFGVRKGIILVGIIWAFWHIPINLVYYSPKGLLQGIIIQLITCIGLAIYFGFVYMKTKNIWIVAMLHAMHNTMLIIVLKLDPKNSLLDWKSIVVLLITYSIVYLPILFFAIRKKI